MVWDPGGLVYLHEDNASPTIFDKGYILCGSAAVYLHIINDINLIPWTKRLGRCPGCSERQWLIPAL